MRSPTFEETALAHGGVAAVVPAKLIISGEHAAVYGKPAVLTTIDSYVETRILPESNSKQISPQISISVPKLSLTSHDDPGSLFNFWRALQERYRRFVDGEFNLSEVLPGGPIDLIRAAAAVFYFNETRSEDNAVGFNSAGPVQLVVDSNVPIGCGLGSSAAVALSVITALDAWHRVLLDRKWLFELALTVERFQHGHTRGVDLAVMLHGGCVTVVNGEVVSRHQLPDFERLGLSLILTGTPECSTGECVAQVKARFGLDSIWSEFEQVTNGIALLLQRSAGSENDRKSFKELVRANHNLLCRVGVVPSRVAAFIGELEQLGGAAKICGAGAVRGQFAGVVLVAADSLPTDLCKRYGYSVLPLRPAADSVMVIDQRLAEATDAETTDPEAAEMFADETPLLRVGNS